MNNLPKDLGKKGQPFPAIYIAGAAVAIGGIYYIVKHQPDTQSDRARSDAGRPQPAEAK
ncbi:hypothetical protein D9611_010454 [Ephemerocybe angulata]|uniref:Uncharacterized protein n=1 Tax=Ephemerocybe angulata TaxID=980116 RepID=A0A8H5FAZ2_9AGAR|nr:hypothetical protein D9611_010454 [Tulosesus angulatus]